MRRVSPKAVDHFKTVAEEYGDTSEALHMRAIATQNREKIDTILFHKNRGMSRATLIAKYGSTIVDMALVDEEFQVARLRAKIAAKKTKKR